MRYCYAVLTSIVSAMAGALTFNVNDRHELYPNCSYLNPPLIDAIAFTGAFVLLLDGFYHLRFKQERTRLAFVLLRIAMGSFILVVHAFQVAYK